MMAVTTVRPTTAGPASPPTAPLALAVADANWFTTENLFREVDRPGVSTLLLKCLDVTNAFRQGHRRPWRWNRPLFERGPALWQRDLVLPSGWMKTYPTWGMRPIRRTVGEWRGRVAPDARLALVMTYPHYLYLRDQVRPDLSVYFNIDDYSQYWPHCAERVNALERQAVREADLTVCASRLRRDELRAAVPEAADRVHHLPHGTPSSSLGERPHHRPAPCPSDLTHLPRPLLGFVGSLEDRVDWPLLTRLADALPRASIVLIGRVSRDRPGAWLTDRRRCLERPNVHAVNWRPQELIGRYSAAFDVCLIPYRVDHPFNRVCCPTKIMDYMGTGRPIVSTDLPECRLYADLFDVATDAESFVESVRRIVAAQSDDGRAALRHKRSQENTCREVAERLLSWLPI